ncbi:hypothetical protein D3C84_1048980 [compost metagenome]
MRLDDFLQSAVQPFIDHDGADFAAIVVVRHDQHIAIGVQAAEAAVSVDGDRVFEEPEACSHRTVGTGTVGAKVDDQVLPGRIGCRIGVQQVTLWR